jgi:AcrR family transcriptional regulator
MKNEIIETALKQFLKFGTREISIQKLIEPLGISTKTVYKYFENKEQLLEEALLFHYQQQFEILENRSLEQNPIGLFLDVWHAAVEMEHKVNSVFFQDLQYYYPEVKAKVEYTIGKKFTKHFIQMIKTGVKNGLIRPDVNEVLVMETIYILFNSITRENRFKDFKHTPLSLLQNTICVYLRGACTLKGAKLLDEHLKTLKPISNTATLQIKQPSKTK